ncbi:hypothetical protein BDP27DRAFT_1423925 [Rhodocollybia butyracea]|uniref:Senescence domain-containing protein n=1 Tax=Rhodocollybia butyracea TaxID=206335 RepID=A0A9P5PN59_9AGAR|nr:hypothetical protein BDP27DRAFT_1423925 [Rhodocollybia butyracea]
MVSWESEAFALLTLSGVTLRSRKTSYNKAGTLTLEFISLSPEIQAILNRDVFLILRIDSDEFPIDPRRVIVLTASVGDERTYIFHGTDSDPEELELHIHNVGAQELQRREDVDTMEGIFSEYADFRDGSSIQNSIFLTDDTPQDLRGHLVLVNQDSGEIIGEVDKKISVHEDPALSKGQEDEPVVIEISEDEEEWKGKAIEVFARKIPADEQDWMTKSAKLVSQGISSSTNLLVNVISSASSYYIAHSAPASASSSRSSSAAPSSFQSKAVALVSSSNTQTGLAHAHALTGQAVKISGKTLEVVDGLISRIIGGRSSAKTANPSASTSSLPPAYSKSPSPIPSMDQKPPLPPRSVSSTTMLSQSSELEKPPLPSQARAITTPPPPLPPRSLKKDLSKLILSADLILSTLDESAKQLLDVGGRNATRMVNHRYGSEAAQSTALVAGSVKNVGLVYIDLRGVGRKAIIRKVGKQFVKNQLKR